MQKNVQCEFYFISLLRTIWLVVNQSLRKNLQKRQIFDMIFLHIFPRFIFRPASSLRPKNTFSHEAKNGKKNILLLFKWKSKLRGFVDDSVTIKATF